MADFSTCLVDHIMTASHHNTPTYEKDNAATTAVLHIKEWKYARAATGSYVEFTVVINETRAVTSPHRNIRVIQKRYAQFAALHEALIDLGFALPKMPTGDLWTNVLIKLTPHAVLDRRRGELQNVLTCISQSQQMQSTAPFREFVATNTSAMNYTSLRDAQFTPSHQITRQETK
ncbi:hypothetical protein DYB37_001240 [Aphanomyces astaci]|nr:hypothetical protein DYB36_014077 [Aphanomyces astaci]RHY38117.1 hypothetical protein DYB34_005133 [Aphanomyces astaci]RHY63279.1 hypothetical protein DYB30_002307 [Aphanomyces astaci]RHY77436.1 hypothetical protein DYB38_012351 [Aphanomyces astaci]RHY83128.1 hypothetical protein DYB35_011793 [Aphanomyces astaci]